MSIRAKLLISFILIAVLVAIGGYFSLAEINKASISFRKDIPESTNDLITAANLVNSSQMIRYYDELLTQSVRNYAFTQDVKWKERYEEAEPKLNKIIKEAMGSGGNKEEDFFSKINESNLALVDMEYRSIALVDGGKSSEAIEILEGEEYWRQKNIYADNLNNYIKERGIGYDEAVIFSTSNLHSTVLKIESLFDSSVKIIASFVVFIFALTLFFGHFISSSVSSPIKKLSAAARKISGGNFNQEIKIKSKDEIGELADAFNIMAVRLRDSYEGLEDKVRQRTARLEEEEKKLRESEERFRIITSSAYDAIIRIDGEGDVVYWNKASEKMFGYREEEIIGKNLHSILTPSKYHEAHKKGFAGFRNTGEGAAVGKTLELSALRKDGTEFPIELSLSSVMVGGEWNAIGVIRDITERKKTEEMLRYSEERLKILFENAPDAIYLNDLSGNLIDGNAVMVKMLGYEKDELRGNNFLKLNLLPLEQIPRAAANLAKSVMGKSTGPDEFTLIRKDGARIIAEISSFPAKIRGETIVMGIIRDITERKRDEEMLRAREARDKALLESIGDGVIAVDMDGRIMFANGAALKMIGYTNKETENCLLGDLLTIEDEDGNVLPKNKRPMRLALDSGKITTTSTSKTYYYVGKNKIKFPAAIIVAPIILDQKIIGAIDVFRDITNEKNIDRMKTEFVSLVSHQLKTPLTVINWFMEMLNKEEVGKLSKKQKEYLAIIYKSSDQMTKLVNGLLNVSRLESGRIKIEPKPMQLEKIIQNLIAELALVSKEKKCKIVFNKPKPKFPLIPLDESLIRQVVLNFLTNAIRYAKPKNGKVQVKIERKDGDFIIEVSDNGIGIPSASQENIFKRFFRAENAKQKEPGGTGLGLYLVKLIIEAAGGRVWFKSEEEVGTSFYASFPFSGMKEKEGEKPLAAEKIS